MFCKHQQLQVTHNEQFHQNIDQNGFTAIFKIIRKASFNIVLHQQSSTYIQKFAGSKPAYLIKSIVAIANPAPFTIHPTVRQDHIV
jgi:hypothetical protein